MITTLQAHRTFLLGQLNHENWVKLIILCNKGVCYGTNDHLTMSSGEDA